MRPCLLMAGLFAAGAAHAQAPTAELNGRLLLDYAEQEVASGSPFIASERLSDRYVRAARLRVTGDLDPRWFYRVEAEVRDGGPSVNFTDVYLGRRLGENAQVRVGNFRTFSIEALTSVNDITFLSRGAYNDLIQADRTTALEAQASGEVWRVSAALISDSINESDADEDSRGWVVRGVWTPSVAFADTVHLGGWARGRDAGPGVYRYGVRSNANIGERFTDAGARFSADVGAGVEAALVRGPWSAQAEYARLSPDRLTPGPDGEAEGGYAFVSWFPTGEQRVYDDGALDGPEILRPVTDGGLGAVELALRQDYVNLGDFAPDPAGASRAGRYAAWTVGATWYPADGFRFMANYTAAENRTPGGEVDVDTLQVRAQYNF